MKKTSLLTTIQSIFLSGFLAIFPLAATILVINFLYRISTQWLTPLKNLQPSFLQKIPGTEFIMMLLIILVVGFLMRVLIIVPVIHHLERLIAKIPLVRSVYTSAKAVVDFFNTSKQEESSRKVVLINFPHKQYHNIAFLLGPASTYEPLLPQEKKKNEAYFRVFMPTSPSPGSGYFFILPQSEIISTTLSFEDAIKIIVSCGLINPKNNAS